MFSQREIPLTKNKAKAAVDLCDYPWLSQYNWTLGNHGYALRRTSDNGHVLMHREIVGAKAGQHVDHIDGNKLNNTRANLRICDHHENLRNARMHKDNSSGFKGVSWNKNAKKWHAQIKFNKTRRVHIGYFSDKNEAARAYDEAAKKYHGKFARLNFNGSK